MTRWQRQRSSSKLIKRNRLLPACRWRRQVWRASWPAAADMTGLQRSSYGIDATRCSVTLPRCHGIQNEPDTGGEKGEALIRRWMRQYHKVIIGTTQSPPPRRQWYVIARRPTDSRSMNYWRSPRAYISTRLWSDPQVSRDPIVDRALSTALVESSAPTDFDRRIYFALICLLWFAPIVSVISSCYTPQPPACLRRSSCDRQRVSVHRKVCVPSIAGLRGPPPGRAGFAELNRATRSQCRALQLSQTPRCRIYSTSLRSASSLEFLAGLLTSSEFCRLRQGTPRWPWSSTSRVRWRCWTSELQRTTLSAVDARTDTSGTPGRNPTGTCRSSSSKL